MSARNCGVLAVVVAGVVVGAPRIVHAQSSPFPSPKLLVQFDQKRRALEELTRAMQSRMASERPKVVCGMTVAPAHPEIDQKSLKKAPDDKKYTMRNVAPELCRADFSQAATPNPQAPTPKP